MPLSIAATRSGCIQYLLCKNHALEKRLPKSTGVSEEQMGLSGTGHHSIYGANKGHKLITHSSVSIVFYCGVIALCIYVLMNDPSLAA